MLINWVTNLFNKNVTSETFEEPCVEHQPAIVWLHGAGQTGASWKYIRHQLQHPNEIVIDYSGMSRFYENLDEIVKKVGDQPVYVVGHSLGGLYALHLTQHCNVLAGVSVSTPFRGSSAADWAKYIVPSYPLFKDVGRKSRPVVEGNKIQITIPWTQVVSTGGAVPYLNGPNDGVCTVSSMTHRKDSMEIVEVESTHYEVMCDDDVVNVIRDRTRSTL